MKKLILCGALLCAFSLSAFAGEEVNVRDPAAVLADGSRAVKVISYNTNGTVNTAGGASTSTTAATLSQGVKAVTTAGTPVLLVAAQTLVESVEIHARKNTTTANTGAIYIGFSSTGGQNYRVLLAGEVWSVTAPAGKKIDLHTIYIDAATSADAVTYTASN